MMSTNNKFSLFLSFSLLSYIVLVFSFYASASKGIDTHKNSLVTQADLHYQDIVNTRAWNAELGGVFAYQGHYKPNPYLKNNTIKDSNGETLIKINPAWMSRMLSEHSTNDNFKFYLKSNTPVNPINQAKGFYSDALKEISQTVDTKNIKRYQVVENTKTFEYIQGLYLEKACMSCHQKAGDKLGFIRGGIAIQINAKPYFTRADEIWKEFYSTTAIVSILFVFLIILVYKFFHHVHDIEILNSTLEEKVKEKASKLKNALEGARLGYWSWDLHTNEYKADERWLFILGLSKEKHNEIIKDWKKWIHPDDLSHVNAIVENAILESNPYVVEFRMKHKNGNYIWIECAGSIIYYDKNSKPVELAGTHQNITQRKELEKESIKNSIYLNTLFDKNPNIIIVTNAEHILKANQAFFKLFSEYDSLDIFLKEHDCICRFFENEDEENFISNVKGKWIGEVFSKEQPIAKIIHNSKIYYFAVQAKKIYEDNNMHYIVTFSDISETYNLKKKFEELSITDPLTGLYNRRYFNKIFTGEINRALRSNQSLTFLIIDIDHFKLYNDNYGHDKGDVLLQALAEQFKASLKRSNEFIFRIGGEEFGVIYSGLSKEESMAHAQEICDSIADMKIEHDYSYPLKILTVSIGHFYATKGDLLKGNQIFHNADQALYFAKENGRNRVEDYDEVINDRT